MKIKTIGPSYTLHSNKQNLKYTEELLKNYNWIIGRRSEGLCIYHSGTVRFLRFSDRKKKARLLNRLRLKDVEQISYDSFTRHESFDYSSLPHSRKWSLTLILKKIGDRFNCELDKEKILKVFLL